MLTMEMMISMMRTMKMMKMVTAMMNDEGNVSGYGHRDNMLVFHIVTGFFIKDWKHS